ncbi:MAG: TATA-box-binding protein, partial [Candidatus Thermoplasmatota archaeon]|nr:TATA-box-binding protein [Candidatus Thermoplasmatota archaeon]
AEYDPVRFSGLVVRLDNPAASFILFRSGIVIVTDVGSETGVKRALKALETFLRASSLLS